MAVSLTGLIATLIISWIILNKLLSHWFTTFWILFVFTIVYFILIKVYEVFLKTNHSLNIYDVSSSRDYITDFPIVLWWTPFIRSTGHIKNCYNYKCIITDDKSYQNLSNQKVYAFYGSDLNIFDLPLPRNGSFWALFHEESPKNLPHLMSEEFLSLFNYTSTFSRSSNLPLTTLYLKSIADLLDTTFFVPVIEKNKLRSKLAPIIYVQSNCNTITNRDAFVRELEKFIKIDSYGSCLHNVDLPDHLADAENSLSEEFLHFVSRYKFTLAIENAACQDYITEKLWRTLEVGSIPIYFGSNSVRDWLPNPQSAIRVSDHENVQELAKYINELDKDNERYNEYLEHKLKKTVSNRLLKNHLKYRRWHDFNSLIEDFECQLCLHLHEPIHNQNVNSSHYNCTFSKLLPDQISEWDDILRTGRCEGMVITDFLSKNFSYTLENFNESVYQFILNGIC